jgi:beta propeller repeat protein
MYNLTSKVETQITTSTANQGSVVIYDDIIAWQDWRHVWRHSPYLDTCPGMSIYIYNLTSQTEEQLQLPQDGDQINPAISTGYAKFKLDSDN